jgi:hypothetical protein
MAWMIVMLRKSPAERRGGDDVLGFVEGPGLLGLVSGREIYIAYLEQILGYFNSIQTNLLLCHTTAGKWVTVNQSQLKVL